MKQPARALPHRRYRYWMPHHFSSINQQAQESDVPVNGHESEVGLAKAPFPVAVIGLPDNELVGEWYDKVFGLA